MVFRLFNSDQFNGICEKAQYMEPTKSLTKGQAEAFPNVERYTCSFYCLLTFKPIHVEETLKYLTSLGDLNYIQLGVLATSNQIYKITK